MAHDRFNHCKSSPTCCWRKRGQQEQALGRSKGGFTTKIHAICDALDNPLKFILTAGNQSDYAQALNLLDGLPVTTLLADKGYDADYIAKLM